MITPRLIRAARALLDWSQQDVADRAGIALNTLARLERDNVDPRASTLSAIEKALIRGGIEFIPESDRGEGVRLAKPEPRRRSRPKQPPRKRTSRRAGKRTVPRRRR